jgi:hypothetical protein
MFGDPVLPLLRSHFVQALKSNGLAMGFAVKYQLNGFPVRPFFGFGAKYSAELRRR